MIFSDLTLFRPVVFYNSIFENENRIEGAKGVTVCIKTF